MSPRMETMTLVAGPLRGNRGILLPYLYSSFLGLLLGVGHRTLTRLHSVQQVAGAIRDFGWAGHNNVGLRKTLSQNVMRKESAT